MPTDPVVILSCDEHTTPPLEAYRPYLERKYHARLEEQIAAMRPQMEFLKRVASIRPHQYAVADNQGALASNGEDGAWDPKRRLMEMDREGVVWGQAHPVANDSQTFHVQPFPASSEDFARWGVYTPEEQLAGARAHNRWMKDFRDATDGRVDAAALIGSCIDMDATLKELEWLAKNGFRTVMLPPPPLNARYDRFWATALGLDLNFAAHAGWDGYNRSGRKFPARLPQEQVDAAVRAGLDLSQLEASRDAADAGKFLGAAYRQFADSSRDFSAPDIEVANVVVGNTTFDLNVRGRGALWQLIISGALDRYPGIKVCFTEIRSDWVPATLGHLEKRLPNLDRRFELTPREYWRRNFRVGVSFIRPLEVQIRHEIGVDEMIFGRDYPHPEGTWPNTYDWIRGAFKGVPEAEARKILGENALDWFGVDEAWAKSIAARIGPPIDDLIGPQAAVDPAKISFFHRLSNYNRPRLPHDPDELDAIIDEALLVC